MWERNKTLDGRTQTWENKGEEEEDKEEEKKKRKEEGEEEKKKKRNKKKKGKSDIETRIHQDSLSAARHYTLFLSTSLVQ